MRKYVYYLLMGLSLGSHLHAEKEIFFFGEFVKQSNWMCDTRKKIFEIQSTLFSNYQERFDWIMENEVNYPTNRFNDIFCAEWKPRKDFMRFASEGIKCTFNKMETMSGSQYGSIEELFSLQTQEYQKLNVPQQIINCKKISDFEGIIEVVSGRRKKVEQILLYQDWVIGLEYYINKDKVPEKWDSWEKHRDFWLERFAATFKQITEKT